MSAFGPKQTSLAAPHMSAFGGKADIPLWGFYFQDTFRIFLPCISHGSLETGRHGGGGLSIYPGGLPVSCNASVGGAGQHSLSVPAPKFMEVTDCARA
jgi:hypothetical protein